MKWRILYGWSSALLLLFPILGFGLTLPAQAELCPKAGLAPNLPSPSQSRATDLQVVTLDDLLPKYFCFENAELLSQSSPDQAGQRTPASLWEIMKNVQTEKPFTEKPDPIVTSANTIDQMVSRSLQLSTGGEVHQLRLEMRSLESKAKIDYSGLIQARVTYLFYASDVIFEMFKPINPKLEVVYFHVDSGSQKITSDQISLRWTLP